MLTIGHVYEGLSKSVVRRATARAIEKPAGFTEACKYKQNPSDPKNYIQLVVILDSAFKPSQLAKRKKSMRHAEITSTVFSNVEHTVTLYSQLTRRHDHQKRTVDPKSNLNLDILIKHFVKEKKTTWED